MERQIPYDITYMHNLKYGTNGLIYKREIHHSQGEQICGCQGCKGVGGPGNLGLGHANYCIWSG